MGKLNLNGVLVGCLGMGAPWSKLQLRLSCQERVSVERELLLLCWLRIHGCMAPLIWLWLLFFVNLPSLDRTK